MNDTIIINYDVYALKSRLYIIKRGESSEREISSDINSFAHEIVNLAQETDIYNIKINAPPVLIKEISHQIHQIELSTYSENRISIGGI